VLLWLDEEPGISADAIQLLNVDLYVHRRNDLEDSIEGPRQFIATKIQDPHFRRILSGIIKLLNDPAPWSRMWICQEVVLAQRLTLILGLHVLDWKNAFLLAWGLTVHSTVSGRKVIPGVVRRATALLGSRTMYNRGGEVSRIPSISGQFMESFNAVIPATVCSHLVDYRLIST
jgi:hypothetical protein